MARQGIQQGRFEAALTINTSHSHCLVVHCILRGQRICKPSAASSGPTENIKVPVPSQRETGVMVNNANNACEYMLERREGCTCIRAFSRMDMTLSWSGCNTAWLCASARPVTCKARSEDQGLTCPRSGVLNVAASLLCPAVDSPCLLW